MNGPSLVSTSPLRLGISSCLLGQEVRYGYNLAAINNKVYVLFLNLDDNTFYFAPIDQENPCDRVLLRDDPDEPENVLARYGDLSRDEDEDEDDAPRGLSSLLTGAREKPPEALKKSAVGGHDLKRMLGQEVREAGKQASRSAGIALDDEDGDAEREKKHVQSFMLNIYREPRKLPNKARFAGVVLAQGQDPVTSGTIPLIFYPHGVAQRALIYVTGAKDDTDMEVFTIEILTMQGKARVHGERLSPDDFKEAVD